jgi:cystathionine beta-synthase
MKNVYANVLECVGRTPIVRLNSVGRDLPHKFYAKLEFMNPGGSVKDRIAMQMIDDAVASGKLKAGGTIIETTSGNTGMGLAMVAAVRGFKCVFVMPDKISDEKFKALRAFGAEVVATPTAVEPEDPRSYYSVARRLAQEIPNSFHINQYDNPSNPKAHYRSTGPEIWEQMGAELDWLVVASGTGGTISGTSKYLKEKNPKVKTLCVDPIGSVFYDYFKTGKVPKLLTTYKVEGFGEDFLPAALDFKTIDEMIQVTDQECFGFARKLTRNEGIFAGGSCGGAVAGALKFAKTLKEPKSFLILLPDGGSKYLSKVYDDAWMKENGFETEKA